MEHVRLFLLMAGTVLAGYLCLCLVAPAELGFSWEAPCRSEEWPDSATVPFPWWDMDLSMDAADSNTLILHGRWGTHRLIAEESADGQGDCVLQLSWQSSRWPFLLRGAASIANVPAAARQAAMDWYPPLLGEDDH